MSISMYLLIGLIYSGYRTPKDVKDFRKNKPELFTEHEDETTVIVAFVSLVFSALLWPGVITAAIIHNVRRKK